ncbi:tetratricopeptide repeat protein [Ramlibacter sp. MAHUQ-53]|uniref:tetratricopeptide repeat protein n=1 Tax=unclassified Ramlibacter TaxID=2617605 RepID=UPI00364487DB
MDTTFNPAGASIEEIRRVLEELPSSNLLTDAEAESIYALARQQVAAGQHEAAFRQFCMLTTFKPTQPRYLNGLALAHRLLGRFEDAMEVYHFALQLDPDDPRHALNVAECLLLMQRPQDALAALEVVIRFCEGRDTVPGVLSRAKALAELLSSKT